MDLLLSIPIASYFFSTSLTSWSTSLNLLFFYMTWSTLILSHSPLKVAVFGTVAIRIVFWLIPSLLFLLFDALLPSLSQSIKHNGSSALPPRDARTLARLLLLALLNLALTTGLEAAIALGVTVLLGQLPFRASTTLPLPWQMAKHLAVLFTAREVLTYYIHRNVLHPRGTTTNGRTRRLRHLAATQHERFAHARRAPPFSLLLMADHPLPLLLHRLVPVYLPALALSLVPTVHGRSTIPRLHLLTYFIFVALSTLEETLTMSGYSVVPGIVLGGMARRTAAHYCRPAVGNFGAAGVLDWAHGTSIGRNVMADVREEAEKHALPGTGKNDTTAGEDSTDATQNGSQGGKKSARRRKGSGTRVRRLSRNEFL